MSKVLSTGFLASFIKPEALTLRDGTFALPFMSKIVPENRFRQVLLTEVANPLTAFNPS